MHDVHVLAPARAVAALELRKPGLVVEGVTPEAGRVGIAVHRVQHVHCPVAGSQEQDACVQAKRVLARLELCVRCCHALVKLGREHGVLHTHTHTGVVRCVCGGCYKVCNVQYHHFRLGTIIPTKIITPQIT